MLFFSRTFPDSQASMMGLNLDGYSGRLPKCGMMRNGVIYEHRILARPTSGNDGCLWPTPQARDWKGRTGKSHQSPNLPDFVDGRLNPDWVEMLMGFPVGWTSPAGLPDAARRSTITNRRASRPANRPTGRRVSRRLATRSYRSRSIRFSRPSTIGLRHNNHTRPTSTGHPPVFRG